VFRLLVSPLVNLARSNRAWVEWSVFCACCFKYRWIACFCAGISLSAARSALISILFLAVSVDLSFPAHALLPVSFAGCFTQCTRDPLLHQIAFSTSLSLVSPVSFVLVSVAQGLCSVFVFNSRSALRLEFLVLQTHSIARVAGTVLPPEPFPAARPVSPAGSRVPSFQPTGSSAHP
jgi:hypothetical protein